jgi:DNA-binding XRE family transcriptional regulator
LLLSSAIVLVLREKGFIQMVTLTNTQNTAEEIVESATHHVDEQKAVIVTTRADGSIVKTPTHRLPACLIRAARGLLSWTVHDLANASGVSVSTINRMEKDHAALPIVQKALKQAFESHGIIFTRTGLEMDDELVERLILPAIFSRSAG